MPKSAPKTSQSQKFKDAAKEAGCSDDETAFENVLRKISAARGTAPKDKGKPVKRG